MMGPYCMTCGGGCPSTGCLKAPFEWGFEGCFLRARFNGIDVKPLDLCKWLYCNETDTKMQLVPNGRDSYIEYYSERDINGCDTGVKTETDKIYVCDLLGLGEIGCLSDVLIEDPKPCQLMVYSPGGAGDDCPGCDEHKKDKWTNYTIPEVPCLDNNTAQIVQVSEDGCLVKSEVIDGNVNASSVKIMGVNSDGCIVKGDLELDDCIKRGSTVNTYTKNAYSGTWTTSAQTGSYNSLQYGPVMGTPSYTNTSDCTLYVRLDASEYICSTAVDGGAYNFALGLSIQSSRADVGGKTQVITWDHLVSSAGTSYGSYQRLTLDSQLHQIVKLTPGQSVNWTVRTFRANYGYTQIINDDGTTASDPNANRWTIQTWRAN